MLKRLVPRARGLAILVDKKREQAGFLKKEETGRRKGVKKRKGWQLVSLLEGKAFDCLLSELGKLKG